LHLWGLWQCGIQEIVLGGLQKRITILEALAGGTALLFDYSGVVLFLGLFIYGIAKTLITKKLTDVIRHGYWYVLGTIGPVCLLWFYQWKSFGHPFYPGRHWMPPVEWIELGYQGFDFPKLELFPLLTFDYRFGLFVSSPLMLLVMLSPFFNRGIRYLAPMFPFLFILAAILLGPSS
jgi:hypothetical protein